MWQRNWCFVANKAAKAVPSVGSARTTGPLSEAQNADAHAPASVLGSALGPDWASGRQLRGSMHSVCPSIPVSPGIGEGPPRSSPLAYSISLPHHLSSHSLWSCLSHSLIFHRSPLSHPKGGVRRSGSTRSKSESSYALHAVSPTQFFYENFSPTHFSPTQFFNENFSPFMFEAAGVLPQGT